MALWGLQFVVAFEPSAVAGAAVSRGLGAPRVKSLVSVPLTPGALVPSPFEPNVVRPDEVRDAVARVAATLGLGGGPACLVLPDGVARMVLLDVPAGITPERFARFRLLGGLPYPAAEALVDVLPLAGSRVLAAAIRRSVVEGYESVAEAGGVRQDRIDLAPLAALGALPPGAAGEGTTVDLVLGEVAVSIAARDAGGLRAFRNRRRDPSSDEPVRLRLDAERTAALAGDGHRPPRLRVVGPGAVALVRRWREQGIDAELAGRMEAPDLPVDSAELPWLGAALT